MFRSLWFYVALITATGALGLGLATTRGIGVTPDAVIYFEAARNLADGKGYVARRACVEGLQPVTTFPPLYSVTLAALARLGIEPLAGARLLSLALVAFNSFLVVLIVRHFVPGSLIAPLVAALLMCCAPTILEVHTTALSEPLFLSLVFVGLFALQLYLERQGPLLLVGASMAFAGAFLTRLSGAALVIAAVMLLLLNKRESVIDRVRDAAICCLISALPAAGVLLRNRYLTGAGPPVESHLDRVGWEQLEGIAVTMGSWLVPGSDRVEYFAGQDAFLIVIVVVGLTAVVWWRRGDEASPGPVVFEVFALAYLGFLLVSIGIYSPAFPIDNRLLSPVFVCALIIGMHRIGILYRNAGAGIQRLATVGMTALAAAYVVAALVIVVQLREHGRGYTGKAWQFDRLLREIVALEPDVVIYSDVPPAVRFLTDRSACLLPSDGWDSPETLSWLQKNLKQGPVAVVRFGTPRRFPPRTQAARRTMLKVPEWGNLEDFDLRPVAREGDATLYRNSAAPKD